MARPEGLGQPGDGRPEHRLLVVGPRAQFALILVGLVVIFDYIIRRTRFGRHVLAVGGNAESARRAGISVTGIRITVFTLAGSLAAFGGIIAASRVLAVSQSSGGRDVLLNSIASAVSAAPHCSGAAAPSGRR